MTEDRVLTPEEIAEKEEFAALFESAKANIISMTETEEQNDLGVKRLYTGLGFKFFWHEASNTCGVEISRNNKGFFGETRYNFHLENGSVDQTGEIGYDFGNESLPELIYAPLEYPMGLFENVRHAPLEVDLNRLRDLATFIDNPIKNRQMVASLAILPGEEKLVR